LLLQLNSSRFPASRRRICARFGGLMSTNPVVSRGSQVLLAITAFLAAINACGRITRKTLNAFFYNLDKTVSL
jgi:hypothetical protein